MTCDIPVTPRTAQLVAPFGILPLDSTNGWSLESLQIGFPAERPVARVRSLADGAFDDTTYLGQRAVTATLRVASRSAVQTLLDQLLPYMSPRYRPVLDYALAGDTPFPERSITLRGVDAPQVIEGPSYLTVVCSWVSVDSYVVGQGTRCTFIPLTATEEGRVYDLTFDRVYSAGGLVGSVIIGQSGNAPAHWTISCSATCTDPQIRINGTLITTSANGGVALTGVMTLDLNSRERTCLIDNDPTISRYNRLNFMDWTWDDLMLQPGDNLVEYILNPGDESELTICWQDTWL